MAVYLDGRDKVCVIALLLALEGIRLNGYNLFVDRVLYDIPKLIPYLQLIKFTGFYVVSFY